MIAIGHVLQDMIGTSTLFSGLGCVPTAPAGMTVNVNPGRAYSLQSTDTGAYSSLNADATPLVKQGILLAAQNFSCPAPTTAGFSINYLVQGAFQEVDGGSTVLPYYNASNPAQAYSGPNGTGTSNTTYRDNTVQLQLKAGVAATTGSQITPTPDAGFNGLWVVTVPFGASTITSANISQYSGAPFLTASLLAQIQACVTLNQAQQMFSTPVGSVRNLAMSVTAASATATLTADQIVVASALNGQPYILPNFSKTINLATTGAGGMDTGSAPVSGYVALYAIYNPTTATAALLATNATAAAAPNVYGGANMPAGYTANALVSIVRTNSSGQIVPCIQSDRLVSTATLNVLNSTASQAAYAALSLASAVPKNAKTWSGTASANCNANGSSINSLNLSADATNEIGNMVISNSASVANQGNFSPISNFPIMTSQTVYYKNLSGTGTPVSIIYVSGYTF
jgi:hypothetical protein